MNDDLRLSYNQLPYDSHAFSQTHPDRLCVVARLFGMTPPPLAGCRVLELGCGMGTNLIAMAAGMPDATFAGIDLSEGQIAVGQKRIDELGLSNIQLRAADIVAAADDLLTFDFIVAHGLYSWAPPPVQEATLRICKRNLAPNGIAYVSYNTYPGWRLRGLIRDAMLYHARQFTDPAVQTAQARAVLDFLAQNTPGDTPYALQLKSELEELRKQPDYYLYHEHLEAYNEPLYFHQFVERAEQAGLQYLGESDFITMLPQNLPPATAETLRRVTSDLVRTEQLMDFLRNRPFRQTLLVHKEVTLNRKVDWRVLEALEVGSAARPAAVPVDERSRAKAQFNLSNGVGMGTTTPITKAAFVLMSLRWPRTAPFVELCSAARARLDADGSAPPPDAAAVDKDREILGSELLHCAAAGIVELRASRARFSTTVPERPVAWPVARLQARTGTQLTNLRHETITVDEFNRQLVLRLDGSRDRATLAQELAKLVENNELAIRQEGVEVRDPGTVRAVMAKAVDENLASLARAALFPEAE
jgi:methyltransferase-like protein/SAM-dependent methyltransferase